MTAAPVLLGPAAVVCGGFVAMQALMRRQALAMLGGILLGVLGLGIVTGVLDPVFTPALRAIT